MHENLVTAYPRRTIKIVKVHIVDPWKERRGPATFTEATIILEMPHIDNLFLDLK